MNSLIKQIDCPKDSILLSAPLERDNIVNGPGIRTILWTQGCRQHCKGCQNPNTWSEAEGVLVKIEALKEQLKTFERQQGITFCGGEPMLQAEALTELARWCKKEMNWDVWCFTGLIYEELTQSNVTTALINELDGLIDGSFILEKRDIVHYKWRGSSNQRLLYIKNGKVIKTE